jgi:hypothetical protein
MSCINHITAIPNNLGMNIASEYISIGGNRSPAAADWDVEGVKLLAFGADNNIALWDPLVRCKCTPSS